MPPVVVRMLFIFVLMFILTALRSFFARRPVTDRSGKKKLEMPNKVQRIGYRVMIALNCFMVFMFVISLFMQDTEMILVTAVMTLIFVAIWYFTRRKFRRFYEESADAFELKNEYMIYRVEYENIVDWIPVSKQIGILDPTQADDQYLCVHFTFTDPEILLRKLAEMTFAHKFKQTTDGPADDPYREQEFINHLENNGYGYIVEELLSAQAKAKD